MSISESNVVDFIGTDRNENKVYLSISDHLGWTEAEEYNHLLLLQEKLNTYIEFVKSGQIYEDYPDACDKKIEIVLYSKFEISPIVREFLTRAEGFLRELGITLNQITKSE
ncbi:DUF6572 domain-containing protein [Cohnella lupini]|uniref:DUF6572 domain-containing protein n=1 Tax=Cohnella lupini TaxID=1294267 RepID=UPI000E280AC7|nr:DUF6572 domain-containing protein [Cohnella lupini]